ncbi:putative hydrolase Ecym_4095 [Eremothecium cymbalariae DBVPG|uniref:DUF676 domain-containing protein n=1 Tax=Eremothecium cymbalariae (strain CBS 270.75 / DBVPG 7215 / KCTC 17166 / NRRL Y-17582) TaxID=931890 RepID=G8JT21_ERECY|nr:hypothetical protein Ecym_4095 [Eremothecium cymbalariae DBVPG\
MFGLRKYVVNQSDVDQANGGTILFDDQQELFLGELVRYKISVKASEVRTAHGNNHFTVRLKNIESALLRPIYLTGPHSLYVDIRPNNYDELIEFKGDDLQYVADLRPDESFNGVLKMNGDARVGESDVYAWTIDVLSQMTVMAAQTVRFRICIGNTKGITKFAIKRPREEIGEVKGFTAEILTTPKLWNASPPFPMQPAHLVIITHGIFSNVGCDMLYLRDQLDKVTQGFEESVNPNLILRGYHGNVARSHKGIEYLGHRLATYIVETVEELRAKYKVDKISFIGHSLGGVVQGAAVRYISLDKPDFFNVSKGGLQPVNFIALASPFLGVVGDFPMYATLALDIGALGTTGRDLSLKRDATKLHALMKSSNEDARKGPVLELIPTSPTKEVFELFVNRTTYANALNDGIVPLRTSALLYLDWYSLNEVNSISERQGNEELDLSSAKMNIGTTDSVEIPAQPIGKRSGFQWPFRRGILRDKKKWYRRSQTRTPGRSVSWDDDDNFTPPTKASALASAANIFVAALPTQQYLKTPKIRTDVIFHDKIYTPEELPPPYYRDREIFKKFLYPNDRIHRVEEQIARNWQETMTWRKVLVNIQPESHNNIIVRRRFVNSPGWVVIDHLVKEHFDPIQRDGKQLKSQ